MSKSGKSQLKVVANILRHGCPDQAVGYIELWTASPDEEPDPNWDLIIGPAFWNRCVDKEMVCCEEDVAALESVYCSLIRAFIRKSQDFTNYMERLKVFGATLKFFIQHKRVNLETIEELLLEIAQTSNFVRKNDVNNFKNVCLNFYALIWNYMRDNQAQFDLLKSLAHASLSIRWLVILGLDQFQNISHKLSQICFLLVKNQMHLNVTIAEFFKNLSNQIMDLLKKVLLDDSKNGMKVKKNKTVLPASHFYGILSMTFVLARQLVVFGDFDGALTVFRPITSVAKAYFDPELITVWKNIIESYIKISQVIMCGVNTKATEEILLSCEMFRDCRKRILDLTFQKAYPGYPFCFMYAFMESIGFAMTASKNQMSNGGSLMKLLPLHKCVKFLKEIQFAADACVALDNMNSGKHSMEGVTVTRKVDVESIALFHILKIAADRICEKDTELDKDFQQVIEASFRTLMSLANRIDVESNKSAELYNMITFHTCNIGYAYQKRKCYKEAMSWCYRSIDAYEALRNKDPKMELKVNALSIGLLLADCHRQLESYTEGLRWLSKWLVMEPDYASNQSTAYDIYEQIPWTDWAVHWLAIQKDICVQNPDQCRSVVDYLEEESPGSVSEKFASKVLRLELNAYFSGRQTVVPAILNVGRQLADNSHSLADQVLGLVGQSVGLWWDGSEEALHCGIQCTEDAIRHLSLRPISKEKLVDTEDEALRSYLVGLATAWKALCMLKMNQNIAEEDLELLKEKLIKENPEKMKDKTDGLYAVPGFTSLTIQDESGCATNLIQATECFYVLSQTEEVFNALTDSYCPAFAQITVRLIALVLSGLGDKVNAARAWYATFVIAKLYDRKGLIVLSASEVLKILPITSMECVQLAEKVNKAALEGNLIKHNKAVYYRLYLAKAIACYYLKNYEEGLRHLTLVYTFLSERDNFDSTHHLIADADYTLSLYRSVAINYGLEFSKDLPEMLCKMTPAGLVVKGYKLLGSLSRETDIFTSGWTDLLHNYYLLGSMNDQSSRTVKLLKQTGKLRDLKCFITDAVFFYQRLGFVSKSLSMLTPLIETDISARNFYMAQIRIAALAKVYLADDSSSGEECMAPPFAEAKKFLETMKIPGLSINRLENVSNLKWHLSDIEAKSFHYRNRCSKYLSSLKVDCEAINIKSIEMKAPAFLRHPLTCFCYTCSHPEIIPHVLEFLTSQAKYAVAFRWKISMAVLELARLHHQRAMFRVLFNTDYIMDQFKPIIAQKTAPKLMTSIYSSFFFEPGFQMQLANMEICPIGDIAGIVHLMNSAIKAVDLLDNQSYDLKAFPLELGVCALFEYFVSGRRILILGGNFRDVIQERVEQQEKENTITTSSPEVLEATIPPIAPPALRRRAAQPPLTKQQQHGRKATVTSLRPRRILNSKAQQQQQELSAIVELVDLTKVDCIDDERNIPIIPAPNFDDSGDD